VLAGQSDGKVARAVGVSRRTILRWRLEDADFVAEMRRRRQRLYDDDADRLRRLCVYTLPPRFSILSRHPQAQERIRTCFQPART
jgi:hypothetical protein